MIKLVTQDGTLIEGPWKDDEQRYHDSLRVDQLQGRKLGTQLDDIKHLV